MFNRVVDLWKRVAAGLLLIGFVAGRGYMETGSQLTGSVAAVANVLLVALLAAVFLRAVRRRRHPIQPA